MSRIGLPKVSSRYGAPMGRHSDPLHSFAGLKVSLRRVPLDGGGYDEGGAYWGRLTWRDTPRCQLYRAYAEFHEGGAVESFFRVSSRDDARQQIIAACEGGLAPRFYR